MADDKSNINNRVVDAILEKPIPFTIGNGRFFYLYQPSLGVSLLAGQLLQDLQLNTQLYGINKQAEILRVCGAQRDLVLRIISLHTFSRRSDVLREERMIERINELSTLPASDLATLIIAILAWDGRQEEFMKHFHLDTERKTREKIYEFKKSKGGSMTFGGRSLYGSVLDAACDRYGWELGYVLWGVSSLNLNMMLADSVQSVMLTKDEAKEAHISTDNKIIEINSKKGALEFQKLIRGK